MKKISVLIPCYNEEANVGPLCEAVLSEFNYSLNEYDCEIVFIDNFSIDKTRDVITKLCESDKRIKAIFNAKNFGPISSPYYGLCQTTGDCTVYLCADFQDPVNMIPKLVKEWENGYKIVSAVKTDSEENALMYFVRTCYYKMIKMMSSVEQIEHFTGFGLYDKSFIDILRSLDDPAPFLRGIVAELGPLRKNIYYKQGKRRTGHSHINWYNLYDVAMLGFTSYTKVGLRIAIFMGFIFSILTMLIAIFYFFAKLLFWYEFQAGMAPIVIGMFFLGSIQLFFLGLLGEYILSINTRVMHRPLVIEEKRINFD